MHAKKNTKAKLARALLEMDTCPNRRLLCFYAGNQNILGLTFSQLTTLSWEFKSNPIDSCLPCRPAGLKGFHGRWVIQRGFPDPDSDHRQQHCRGALATSHTVFLMAANTVKGPGVDGVVWSGCGGGVGLKKRPLFSGLCIVLHIVLCWKLSPDSKTKNKRAHKGT